MSTLRIASLQIRGCAANYRRHTEAKKMPKAQRKNAGRHRKHAGRPYRSVFAPNLTRKR